MTNRKRSQTVIYVMITGNRNINFYIPIDCENVSTIFLSHICTSYICTRTETKTYCLSFKFTGNLNTPCVIEVIHKHPTIPEIVQYFRFCQGNAFNSSRPSKCVFEMLVITATSGAPISDRRRISPAAFVPISNTPYRCFFRFQILSEVHQ